MNIVDDTGKKCARKVGDHLEVHACILFTPFKYPANTHFLCFALQLLTKLYVLNPHNNMASLIMIKNTVVILSLRKACSHIHMYFQKHFKIPENILAKLEHNLCLQHLWEN